MEGGIRSDDSRCFLAPVWSKFEVFEHCDLVENRLDRPKKKCVGFPPASQRPRKGRQSICIFSAARVTLPGRNG